MMAIFSIIALLVVIIISDFSDEVKAIDTVRLTLLVCLRDGRKVRL
jgi:hypothetical protein